MSDHTVNEFEHAGLTVKIEWDDTGDAPNPRDDCNVGVMECWHPDYTLGDVQFTHSDYPGCESMEAVGQAIIERENPAVILPLYLYDHSGLRMKVGSFQGMLAQGHAEFDTTFVGFIYSTKKTLDETGCPEDKIEEGLRAEVDVYDSYLMGEVYGFVIEDDEGEHLESCWGFVGDQKYCEESAREAADACAQQIAKETDEAAHWAARDTVTV